MNRLFLPVIAAVSGALWVGACAGPGPIPRGYTHHHERFKSPDPGPSAKFNDAQRAAMTPLQARQLGYAVQELTQRLTERAGLAPRPVYVQTADPLPPFYAMMDNDVRDALVRAGYRLSDTPEGAYVIQYDAAPIKPPEVPTGPASATVLAAPVTQSFNRAPNVILQIKIMDGPGKEARLLTTQSGDYFIQGIEVMDVPPARFPVLQKAGTQ